MMRVCQRQRTLLKESLRESLSVSSFTRAFLKSPSSRGFSVIAELLVQSDIRCKGFLNLFSTRDSRFFSCSIALTRVITVFEVTHFHGTRKVFNAGEVIWKYKKDQNPWWLVWLETPLRELTSLPGLVADPAQSPKASTPVLSTSGFQLHPLGPKQLRAPNYCWIRAPQSLATPLGQRQGGC